MWTEARTPDGSDDDLLTGFEKVILHRDDPTSYLYRGIVFFHKGYYWLAEQDFRQAIKEKETSSAAWYDLALTQQKEGTSTIPSQVMIRLLPFGPNF